MWRSRWELRHCGAKHTTNGLGFVQVFRGHYSSGRSSVVHPCTLKYIFWRSNILTHVRFRRERKLRVIANPAHQPDSRVRSEGVSANKTRVYSDTVDSQQVMVGLYLFLPIWMALLVPMVRSRSMATLASNSTRTARNTRRQTMFANPILPRWLR